MDPRISPNEKMTQLRETLIYKCLQLLSFVSACKKANSKYMDVKTCSYKEIVLISSLFVL
ncbi:hypothetical protein YC2023_067787 [Brassica napus]